ncbi:MAG: hypothetical protein WD941_04275 [Opitutus sp.]
MRDDQHRFLTLLGQLPARLTAEQTAWVLNCQPHDIPVLVVARLLKPLGNPQPNSVKYFATTDVLALANNRAWLGKITNVVSEHWKQRNLRKKDPSLGWPRMIPGQEYAPEGISSGRN